MPDTGAVPWQGYFVSPQRQVGIQATRRASVAEVAAEDRRLRGAAQQRAKREQEQARPLAANPRCWPGAPPRHVSRRPASAPAGGRAAATDPALKIMVGGGFGGFGNYGSSRAGTGSPGYRKSSTWRAKRCETWPVHPSQVLDTFIAVEQLVGSLAAGGGGRAAAGAALNTTAAVASSATGHAGGARIPKRAAGGGHRPRYMAATRQCSRRRAAREIATRDYRAPRGRSFYDAGSVMKLAAWPELG